MLHKSYLGNTTERQLRVIDELESAYGKDDVKRECVARIDADGKERITLNIYDPAYETPTEFWMTCETQDDEDVVVFTQPFIGDDVYEIDGILIGNLIYHIDRVVDEEWYYRDHGCEPIPLAVGCALRDAGLTDSRAYDYKAEYNDILECVQTTVTPDADDPTAPIVRIDQDLKAEEFRVYAAISQSLDGNRWKLNASHALDEEHKLGESITQAMQMSALALDPIAGMELETQQL